MAQIPYELWLHITSFLVNEEIWALRTLNKSLHDIAMDKRFQTIAISLNDAISKHYRRHFLRFIDDDIALRVRELGLYPYARIDFPPAIQSSRRSIILSVKQLVWGFVKSDKDFVIRTIQSFKNLRHVKINFQFPRGRAFKESIPLIHACLLSHSNHLQSLELSYPFDSMETFLSPTLFFPHLKSISVTLFTAPDRIEVNKAFSYSATRTLAPFINRHRFTLTALDLTPEPLPPAWSIFLAVMSTNFNLYSLYKSLDHIPNLRTLSISLSASTPPDCIFHFLKMHSNTLGQLTIHMTDTEINTTHGVLDQFEIPILQLEEFTIRYHYDTRSLASSSYQEPTLGFIRQHASSLVSLKLLNSFHTKARFLAFLDPVVLYHKLRFLKMSLQILTPEMLDILSSRLQSLHELELLVRYLKRRHTCPEEINEEYEFCSKIRHHDYQHWKLRHLTLTLENRGRSPGASYGAAAVAARMPFLQTFNGMPWGEYIHEAQSIIDVLPHITYECG